ncbi:MAG: hypothetical protein HC927_02370 [Deltaproteobacteria bacterium]|nr:hypothetical protein [Deltaproteobacteria bacterium]
MRSWCSGHECSWIPLGKVACDHIEEQLSSVRLWGTEFAAARVPVRYQQPQPETSIERGRHGHHDHRRSERDRPTADAGRVESRREARVLRRRPGRAPTSRSPWTTT